MLTLFDGVHPIQNATRGKSQNGLGVGAPGDPMYTLDRASQHGVAAPAVLACSPPCSTKLAGIPAAPVIGFNARQDPDSWAERTGPLDTNGATQAVAFSCKDHGADATVDMAPTLRAMGHQSTHANGGGQLAVAFAQNSRDEVRLMGGDGGIVGALAAQPGMKQTCYVAQCVTGDITHTLKAEGFDASEDGTGRGQPIVTAYAFQPRIARNGRGDMGEVVAALTAQAGATGKGDAAPCVAITAYDTTQITSAANGSRPQPGDPCHPLAAGAHPPLIVGQDAAAYTTKPHNTTSNQAGKFYEEYTTALDRSSPPPALVHNMAVRRLTPRECERLQGFPDDYTLIPLPMIARAQRRKESAAKYEFYLAARKARHAADGPRYKALGNSMAVPCMAWLGARIALELAARPAR